MKVLMLVLGNELNTGEVKTEIMRCGEATNVGLGQLYLDVSLPHMPQYEGQNTVKEQSKSMGMGIGTDSSGHRRLH